jgi:hypothetical protein
MVGSKAAVSLTRLAVLLWALVVIPPTSAQPSDLFECVRFDLPPCRDLVGGIVFSSLCPGRRFEIFLGYFAWFPLRNVGPIEVEVEAASTLHTLFPLQVQIVPLDGVNQADICENALGYVVMTLYPRRSRRPDPCNFWESSGIVDISSVVPVGGTYALRIYSFTHPLGVSPGVDCVRVTSHPIDTAVVRGTWGGVKCLYR